MRFPYFPFPFRFLSSASVPLPATQLSASSFPFFSLLPHSGFHDAPIPLSLPRLPHSFLSDFSYILSWFPYSASCWFPFVLPCFAPAAVPQVIPFQISPPGPVPDFRFLSSTSVLASHYSASVSSFPFSSCLRLTVASSVLASCVFPVLSSLISHAFLPGSGTQLPVCFLSSFPASLPQLFHRCLPSAFAFGLSPSFPLSFVCFFSGSDYSAFCSSFPFFPAPPLSGFPGARFRFRFFAFPFLSGPISRAFLPGSRTRLSVCFLSSFPVSLPQPFHRCFPSFPLSFVRFSSGLFCLLSAFFRPLQPASDYSAFCPFFSLLPVLPWQQFLRCLFSSSVRPVSMPSFRFRYSAFCISFLRPPFRLTVATSASQPSSLRLPAFSPWLSL